MQSANAAAAALLALLTCAPGPARAEDPGLPATLPADTASMLLADRLPRVEVIGNDEALQQEPGSGMILDESDLSASRVLTVNEALRKVPGVHVRDEEGFGLRPNIGVRGLNPTRSTKVLLLEDGIPAAYAPYGDNASYYHAPIERYARVEVLKGVGMLRFGPQTIGGVINYVTPDPPEAVSGYLQASAGSRDYANVHLSAGGHGALLDLIHKRGDGARENLELEQSDLNLKYVAQLGAAGDLTLRLNHLREDSMITYSGITDAELANFGREYNPFRNDHFDATHDGLSLTHELVLGDGLSLLTNLYGFTFHRDWWRQSSTTSDTQCGNAFRDARFRGEAVDPDACASRQGRLRDYYTRGIEPRLRLAHAWPGGSGELEVGLRRHTETQQRLQLNAASATGSTGTLVESNKRGTEATALFVQDRIEFGALSLVPALRYESIDYSRRNRLTGRAGEQDEHELIPGLGLNYTLAPELTLFAGVHEGYAPPRAEDLIDNAGGSVELDGERSTNLELGLRARVAHAVDVEFALFRNDFSNQILVGSIAGGSTPLATGETLYQGAELGLRWDQGEGAYAQAALTWLPTASQESALTAVANGQPVGGSASGKRLPYAPRALATTRLGYRHGPWDGSIELQAIDSQYADFANTEAAPVNGSGQVGRIAGHGILNLALNWAPAVSSWSAFATLKNVADRTYIVDRTRGIQLGNPRQFVAGLRYAF